MDPIRNTSHIVPVMNHRRPKKIAARKVRATQGTGLEETVKQVLKLDRETDRALSTNAKGKIIIAQTECWEKYSQEPQRHILVCGHSIKPPNVLPCGPNCQPIPNATRRPHGNTLRCRKCYRKEPVLPFIPKRPSRRHTLSTLKLGDESRRRLEDERSSFQKNTFTAVEEEYREQLEKATKKYEKRKTIFETLPPPMPRKRRAADEPTFAIHDHPTGEKPKRRATFSHKKKLAEIDHDELDEEGVCYCVCKVTFDHSMLKCAWCTLFFHPECTGYDSLTRAQFLGFANGDFEFFCQNCKEDYAESEVVKEQERKRKKTRASLDSQDKVAPMADRRSDNLHRRALGEKKLQDEDVFRANIKGPALGVKGKPNVKDGNIVKQDTMEVNAQGVSLTPAPRRPTPPKHRFTLSANKFTRKAGK